MFMSFLFLFFVGFLVSTCSESAEFQLLFGSESSPPDSSTPSILCSHESRLLFGNQCEDISPHYPLPSPREIITPKTIDPVIITHDVEWKYLLIH